MIYIITLDPGTSNERLFVAPANKHGPVVDDLRKYCDEIISDGPYDFVEIPAQMPTYDPQDL